MTQSAVARFEAGGTVPERCRWGAVARQDPPDRRGADRRPRLSSSPWIGVSALLEPVEGVGVVHAVDGEDVQVVAVPLEQDLNDLVELGQGGRGG
jgi:hypothetical protein